MKVIGASQIPDFKCIGGKCEDTCCAGWYIGIDEKTYKKYKKVKDPVMKKRLDKELVAKNTSEEHAAKVKLKNNRCAFLSKEGLCDIYTCLGESYLSETCTLFPRTFNKIGEEIAYSIALSCPEAARMILLNKEGYKVEDLPIIFKDYKISASLHLNQKKPQKWQDYLMAIQKVLIALIQNKHKGIIACIEDVEDFLLKLSTISHKQNLKEIQSLINVYSHLEQLPASSKHPFKQKWEAEQFNLLLDLKALRAEKKWPSAAYEAYYEEMISALNLQEKEDSNQFKTLWLQRKEKYLMPFLEEKPYILSNYFANYIFERLVPLDGGDILESLTKFEIYKQLILAHLIGFGESLDANKVVNFIQAFSKVFDHNEIYMYKLLKSQKNKKK